ncbi:hypothetical protein HOY82DRAFT_538898 [Tuber indicum]|nr:hypothetical protein HOY82DRAFT_538898 [Tuber indicum]
MPFVQQAYVHSILMLFSPDFPRLSNNSKSHAGPTQLLRTPKTRRDLRYQTNAAVRHISSHYSQSKSESIAFILRLAHLAEVSYSRAEIESFETQKLREEFAGKKAARTDHRILSKARIITGAEVVRLKKEREEKDALILQRKQAREKNGKPKGRTGSKSKKHDGMGRVRFVIEEDGEADEEEDFQDRESEVETESSSDVEMEFVTPQTGRTRHPILSPISTPLHPNKRLPDRALSMQLRSRK